MREPAPVTIATSPVRSKALGIGVAIMRYIEDSLERVGCRNLKTNIYPEYLLLVKYL